MPFKKTSTSLSKKAVKYSKLELAYAKLAFKMSSDDRRRVWRKLGKLLKNNVPIKLALETIRRPLLDRGKQKDPIAIAMTEWINEIAAGTKLSTAISSWVSPEEMMILAAGEQSGEIEKALESINRIIESKKKVSKAVVGGTVYPIFLCSMAIYVLTILGNDIVPAFERSAPNIRWTGVSAFMVDIANFVQNWLVYVIVALVSGVTIFFVSLPRFDGKIRVKLDRYPPYSIYRIIQGSSWLISFAALIEAGVRMEKAMEQMASQSSPWLRNRINATLRQIRSGYSTGESLARTGYEFPDREIIDDLAVYSSLSGFNQALQIIGNEWIEEAVTSITARMNIIFIISIMFVASVVLLMVSGLFSMQEQVAQAMRVGG